MVLALSEASDVAVAVAAIAAVASVASAWLARTAHAEVGQKADDLADRIGEPNGKGSVVQMLTTLLNGQAGQDNRIAHLEGTSMQQSIDLAALDDRLRAVEHPPD